LRIAPEPLRHGRRAKRKFELVKQEQGARRPHQFCAARGA
jgi:hypothetical protein